MNLCSLLQLWLNFLNFILLCFCNFRFVYCQENNFFLSWFLFTWYSLVTGHQGKEEINFYSSLILPLTSRWRIHHSSNYCRELTSAYSLWSGSYWESLASECKSLTTKLRKRKRNKGYHGPMNNVLYFTLALNPHASKKDYHF